MTTPTPELRESFRFMLDNAGYCVPPGRAQCALDLARAEQRLRREIDAGSMDVLVEYDPGDENAGPQVPGRDDPEYRAFQQWREWWQAEIDAGRLEIVTVALERDGEIVASLGSVDSSPDDGYSFPLSGYRRVVAAELASEHFFEIDRETAERAEWEARDTVTV